MEIHNDELNCQKHFLLGKQLSEIRQMAVDLKFVSTRITNSPIVVDYTVRVKLLIDTLESETNVDIDNSVHFDELFEVQKLMINSAIELIHYSSKKK